MDFKQLESFIGVVNYKSFSKAAEKMFISQPTITNHIQTLEEELGTMLFIRSNKKNTLTENGNIFYRYAVDLINLRNMAINNLSKFSKVEGRLEISSSSIPGQYVLPYILREFVTKYCDVSFKINHLNSQKVIDDIIDGYVNYGIVGGKEEHKFLEYIDFFDDNLVAITPNNQKYKCNPYKKLSVDFLYDEKIILREKGSGTRVLFEKELEKKNIKLNKLNIITIEDNETIKKLVELGLGISIISELAVKKEIELGLVKPYYIQDLELNRKFYYVYHKNRYLSPLDIEFKNYITNYSKKLAV